MLFMWFGYWYLVWSGCLLVFCSVNSGACGVLCAYGLLFCVDLLCVITCYGVCCL